MGDTTDCIRDLITEALAPLDGLNVACRWICADDDWVQILVSIGDRVIVHEVIDMSRIGTLAAVEWVLSKHQRPLAAVLRRQQANLQSFLPVSSGPHLHLIT